MARKIRKTGLKHTWSKRNMVIAGLDLSLTGSAFCSLSGNGDLLLSVTFKVPGRGMDRVLAIEDGITKLLYSNKPDVLYVEGFAYSMRGSAVYELGMLGGVIRRRMLKAKWPDFYVEVSPTSLKKFICGKGNANKNLMLEQTFRRYCVGSETLIDDNQVDAYGLAQLGRAHLGYEDKLIKAQQEALKKVPRPWDDIAPKAS